jgi:ABC-type sulfate/molybdate transport systems, ATPase component
MKLYVDIEKTLPGFDLKVKFDISQGTLGLLGASGSGKSMTLRCIAGIDTPTKGKIILNDRVFYDSEKGINLPIHKRKVGFLFQNYALFPHMTISENISFALTSLSKEEKNRIVKEKVTMMQLDGLEDRFPHELSGGQQQRAAFARALAVNPEILLLDEPFSALDNYLRAQVQKQLIDTLVDYKGATVFVSHNMDEIYRICDNLAVISKGKVTAYGLKQDIFNNPPNLPAAQLTGCKNISETKSISPDTVEALDWGCTLKVSKKTTAETSYVGIRAHYISIVPNEDLINTFKCVVNYVIEGPFGVTVYLKGLEGEKYFQSVNLHWEISRKQWTDVKSLKEPLNIHLSPDQLFLTE